MLAYSNISPGGWSSGVSRAEGVMFRPKIKVLAPGSRRAREYSFRPLRICSSWISVMAPRGSPRHSSMYFETGSWMSRTPRSTATP